MKSISLTKETYPSRPHYLFLGRSGEYYKVGFTDLDDGHDDCSSILMVVETLEGILACATAILNQLEKEANYEVESALLKGDLFDGLWSMNIVEGGRKITLGFKMCNSIKIYSSSIDEEENITFFLQSLIEGIRDFLGLDAPQAKTDQL